MNDNRSPNESRETSGQLVPAAQAVPMLRSPYGLPAAYGGIAVDPLEEPDGFNLVEYWRLLKKRKWLILSIAAAFVAVGAARTLMQTPLYTSTVRIQVDPATKIVEGGDVSGDSSDDGGGWRTQSELLSSRTMAERVASALKLGNDADFLQPRDFNIIGAITGLLALKSIHEKVDPTDLAAAATEVVLGNREVRPITGSRLFDVSYSDPNPWRAQKVANAYADAFTASSIDKRFQANAYAKTFLEDKIKQLKIRLEDSERTLVAFAQKQEIVTVQEKTSITESNLAAANDALGKLIAERTKNEELWRQVEKADAISDAISLPQLLSNKVIENLRAKRNDLVVEYQEKLELLKPSYPTMVQINNKIRQIEQQLTSEVQTTRDSLKAAYESALSQEQTMKKRVDALKRELLDLQKRSIEYNIVKREVDTNRELYTSLLQRYKEVDVAGGVGASNVFVVDRAMFPSSPSSPRLLRALILALAFGLTAGYAAAYLLERFDDRIRSVEEAEQATGLPTLGVIPKVHTSAVAKELANPRSALSDAYRSLCTALQFTTDSGLPRTLVITSTGPSEGKSITSMVVAKHFAALGRKVLLVDADLRNPSLHRLVGSENEVGLSNYLAGACAPPEAMQATELPKLAFIASGPIPPNAADLLGSARLHSLLSIGLEVFDLIVLDAPPVMGIADAQLLSSAAAGTLFVMAAGEARTRFVRGALRRLRLSRSSIIGAALTKFDAKAAGYGYDHSYGYGYGYGYGYDDRADTSPRGLSIRTKDSKSQPQLTDARTGETLALSQGGS